MKRGILMVAYGAGSMRGTTALRSVQSAVEKRFGLPVRWAFTSETMRIRLARSRTKSDSVLKALTRMGFERYTHVAVQSLHLIPGEEYSAVVEDCTKAMARNRLDVRLGLPLLHDADSISTAARTLIQHVSAQRSPEESVVCMAHGSRRECDILYHLLADSVHRLDPRIHIACMQGASTLDELLPLLNRETPPPCRVWLMPLLSLAGRHTLEDMAGAAPSSWKKRIERSGWQCIPELRGLADDPAFVALWMDRLKTALDTLSPQTAASATV